MTKIRIKDKIHGNLKEKAESYLLFAITNDRKIINHKKVIGIGGINESIMEPITLAALAAKAAKEITFSVQKTADNAGIELDAQKLLVEAMKEMEEREKEHAK